jgi:hypothetical protein
MTVEDEELRFYRSVEDLFASMRGVPHTLSPRDFQLLRSWWQNRLPLAAVLAGITEVFARRRESDDGEPVVSLSYCRHAVHRHARRLAEMRTGGDESCPTPEAPGTGPEEALGNLAARLSNAADRLGEDHAAAADPIRAAAEQLVTAAELPPAALDQHLYSLETTLLHGCWQALDPRQRELIDDTVLEAARATGATGEALQRSCRVLRDRRLRELLSLPRMELE